MELPNNFNIFSQYLSNTQERSWVIRKSDLGGRGLFARVPIKKGCLIFWNKPLVLGPRPTCGIENYCAYCYDVSSTCYPCDKCLITVCSLNCELSQNHVRECSYICDNWKAEGNFVNVPSTIITKGIIYLRSILLQEDQKDVLNLLQRCEINPTNCDFDDLRRTYSVPDGQIEFMKDMYGILRANSFRVNSEARNKVPLRGVYPVSSFLNHSCLPNTRNVFLEDYSMAVYAARDIEDGEEILCCYTGLLWCTPMRRIQLYKSKSFWCECARCRDPSELGTHLGALKCMDSDCSGYLLPTHPLNPKSIWKCGACSAVVPSGRVNTVQSILGSLVGALDVDDLELNENVLRKIQMFVPDCNHILVELRLRRAIRLGNTYDETKELSDCRLELKESLCRDTLRTLAALGAGDAHLRGLLLYHLHAALAERARQLSDCRLELKESLCRDTLRTLAALGAGDAHLRGLLLYHLHAALAERARRAPELYEELKSEIEFTIEQAHSILQDDLSAPPDLDLRRKYLGPGCDKPQEERFFILSEATKNNY